MYLAYCPVVKHQPRLEFTGVTMDEAIEKVREHIKANLEDPNHSEIADMEGWFDPDPLGD